MGDGMKLALAGLGGLALGLVVASYLREPSSCCARVAGGVRDEVGDTLGATAQGIGDALGIWGYTPGLLDLFGVK